VPQLATAKSIVTIPKDGIVEWCADPHTRMDQYDQASHRLPHSTLWSHHSNIHVIIRMLLDREKMTVLFIMKQLLSYTLIVTFIEQLASS
jgi:hypothetical protein